MNRYKYFTHQLFIGFLLSGIAIFAFAKLFPYHKFEIVDKSQLSHNGEVYYCDLDNDGNSENLNFYQYNKIFNPTIYIYNSDSTLQSLWNIFETPAENSKLFFGDYNQNGVKEIFLFTEHKDSLFLYIINPKNKIEYHVKRRFVMALENESHEYHLFSVGLLNFNEDSFKDFYFAFTTDHPSVKGKIFAYDIANDSLYKSEGISAKVIDHIVVNDLNGDGKSELVVSTEAKENNINGSSAQLLVLNHKLEYFFQPYKIQGTPSRLFADVVVNDDDKYIIALNSGVEKNNVFNSLMLFDLSGNRVDEKILDFKTNLFALNSNLSENCLTLFTGYQVLKIGISLEVKKEYRLTRKNKLEYVGSESLDNDTIEELFFVGDDLLYFFNSNYKKIGKLKISNGQVNYSIKRYDNKSDQIFVQAGSDCYLISYKKNMVFFYRYLAYLIIFVFITFIVYLIANLLNNWRYKQQTSIKSAEKNNFQDEFGEIATDNPHKIENVIGQFNDPFLQVKEKLDFRKGKSKQPFDFKNEIEKITKKFDLKIETSFYPSGDWLVINQPISDTVTQLLKYILDSLPDSAKSINIQIVHHKEYINILFEFPDIDYRDFFTVNEVKVLKILKKVNGDASFDFSNGIGTIANIYIPLYAPSKSKSIKSNKIRIIIAEDHDVSLFGLVTLFKNKSDIEIVGTAKNGMEVLKILESKKADIVITDISMPGMDGIELAEKLNLDYHQIKVIVFTMYMENWFVEQLIKHETKGFVAKNSKIDELIKAVYFVYEGNNYYCPQFKSKYGFNNIDKKESSLENQFDSLNSYEKKIMNFFADNVSRIKISEKLNVNTKTLETFIANIMLKLNAGDEREIIQLAKKQKYISG
ncbi:MAG: response regulator [Thiohalospira sp.]